MDLYRKWFIVSLDIDDFAFIAHAQKRQSERMRYNMMIILLPLTSRQAAIDRHNICPSPVHVQRLAHVGDRHVTTRFKVPDVAESATALNVP